MDTTGRYLDLSGSLPLPSPTELQIHFCCPVGGSEAVLPLEVFQSKKGETHER